jgi:hypothetical protein
VLKKLKVGDDIVIRPMEAPEHFHRVDKHAKDSKYYDAKKEEDVYFPRLGAFEIYVDQILIFSKIRSNMWPSVEKQAETIIAMLQAKKRGQALS